MVRIHVSQQVMESIKTKSFDLAVYSKGDPSSPRLAIVIPGRLDTKDYFHNTSLVDHLAELGYFALSFDPPGTWESPGSIDLYTTTNVIAAVHELIEHFENKPTIVAGHSRGGTVAMLVGPKNPYVTHIISIFSYYGAPSDPEPERIVDEKLVSYRDLPPGIERTKEQKKFELPLLYFEDGAKYDALPGLKSCNKPKLFFYGTLDTMNEPEDVKEAFEASAEPKEIHGIVAEHDYRLQPQAVKEINEVIGQFLSKSL
jgi:predicted alpha/beta-hydrolase family hydrolase